MPCRRRQCNPLHLSFVAPSARLHLSSRSPLSISPSALAHLWLTFSSSRARLSFISRLSVLHLLHLLHLSSRSPLAHPPFISRSPPVHLSIMTAPLVISSPDRAERLIIMTSGAVNVWHDRIAWSPEPLSFVSFISPLAHHSLTTRSPPVHLRFSSRAPLHHDGTARRITARSHHPLVA